MTRAGATACPSCCHLSGQPSEFTLKRLALPFLVFVSICSYTSQTSAENKAVNRLFIIGFEVATCMIGIAEGQDAARIAADSSNSIKGHLDEVAAPESVRERLNRYIKSIVDRNKDGLETQMISLVNGIADHGRRQYGDSGYHAALFGMWTGMVTVSIAFGKNPYEIVVSGKAFIPWLENDRRVQSRRILATILNYRYTDVNRPDFSQKYMRTLYTLVQSFAI